MPLAVCLCLSQTTPGDVACDRGSGNGPAVLTKIGRPHDICCFLLTGSDEIAYLYLQWEVDKVIIILLFHFLGGRYTQGCMGDKI